MIISNMRTSNKSMSDNFLSQKFWQKDWQSSVTSRIKPRYSYSLRNFITTCVCGRCIWMYTLVKLIERWRQLYASVCFYTGIFVDLYVCARAGGEGGKVGWFYVPRHLLPTWTCQYWEIWLWGKIPRNSPRSKIRKREW